MTTINNSVPMLPLEANGLSILVGTKRGSDSARATFERLMGKGWFKSDMVVRIAEAIVDPTAETRLDSTEKKVLQVYLNWAARNRAYTQNRRKKSRRGRKP